MSKHAFSVRSQSRAGIGVAVASISSNCCCVIVGHFHVSGDRELVDRAQPNEKSSAAADLRIPSWSTVGTGVFTRTGTADYSAYAAIFAHVVFEKWAPGAAITKRYLQQHTLACSGWD